MLNILLVDDESLTLEYLSTCIPQLDSGWSVIGQCHDGIEALQWLSLHSADLIITDIKMPEMTGIDLCRQIHLQNPKQKIVILSGYDEFKFAQQAIRYGVKHYLLKPIDLAELEQILKSIQRELLDEQIAQQAYDSLLELSQSGKKEIVNRFIQAIINGSHVEIRSLYPLLHRMKIDLIEGAAILIIACIDEGTLISHNIPIQDLPLYKYMLYQYASDYAKTAAQTVWVSLDRRENTIILLSSEDQNQTTASASSLFDWLNAEISKSIHAGIFAGASMLFDDIFQTAAAYDHASSLLIESVLEENPALPFFAPSRQETSQSQALRNRLKTLKQAILEKQPLLQKELEALIDLMPAITPLWYYRFAVLWIKDYIYSYQTRTAEDYEYYLSLLAKISSFSREHILERYKTVALLLTQEKQPYHKKSELSESKIVSEAQHYIRMHFAEPISLVSLADQLDVSPNYLSSLLHKELQESYIKYLTRIRMEHAIKLMKADPQLRLQDIIEQVGYVNVKHFSYVFKQTYSISPGKYMQSLRDSFSK